jgi:predicted anti-sigma-YlaC factor YlaD
MEQMNSNCTGMESKLANLLLDPALVSAEVQAHVEGCESCRRELNELRETMSLMDSWEAPEPSPYFLTRLEARQREVREAEPAGWLARLRASLVYGSRAHVRPLAAMAMTLLLLVGGGTYLGVTNWDQPSAAPETTAVVRDLQTMDSNAQLLDQLEALSNNVDDDSDNSN